MGDQDWHGWRPQGGGRRCVHRTAYSYMSPASFSPHATISVRLPRGRESAGAHAVRARRANRSGGSHPHQPGGRGEGGYRGGRHAQPPPTPACLSLSLLLSARGAFHREGGERGPGGHGAAMEARRLPADIYIIVPLALRYGGNRRWRWQARQRRAKETRKKDAATASPGTARGSAREREGERGGVRVLLGGGAHEVTRRAAVGRDDRRWEVQP